MALVGQQQLRGLFFKGVATWAHKNPGNWQMLRGKWVCGGSLSLVDEYPASEATVAKGALGGGALEAVAVLDDPPTTGTGPRAVTWNSVDGGEHGAFAELSAIGIGGRAAVMVNGAMVGYMVFPAAPRGGAGGSGGGGTTRAAATVATKGLRLAPLDSGNCGIKLLPGRDNVVALLFYNKNCGVKVSTLQVTTWRAGILGRMFRG